MVEGIDYCFIYPKEDGASVHIRFLIGEYKDTVFKYGKVVWKERDDGYLALHFKLDVLECDVDKPKNLEKNREFINYVGSFLMELMRDTSEWIITDETGTSDTEEPDL